MSLVVGIAVVELHLPESRSLKHKRKIVKSLIERVRQRFRVSIREIEYHDLHQRSKIGLALVASSEHDSERILERIRRIVEDEPEAMVLAFQVDLVSELS